MDGYSSPADFKTYQKQKIHLTVDFDRKSQFTGRSIESGLPVTLPLKDLEDLLAWKPDDQNDAGQIFSIATVPYYGKDVPKGSAKTLVCHDMAGGYLDDRFVQGSLCTDDKWYYLAYWDIVDTFVYFSHHFITIPPVGWINSAHLNGVAVLGTFITEWHDGFKRCEAIFSYEWLWKKVADTLVQIAKYYRFEGWLLNIENKISKENLEKLRSFVKYLTDQMHDAIEGSMVIWYDSVTDEGELEWQNELNSKNRVYFEQCDGIFLNYGWKKSSLERSAETAMVLGRVEDVYAGVDVFGRGTYGGGGMNTAAALEIMRRYKLSAAIFAPGWVKEVLGSKDFEENQRKFWTRLAKYCNTHTVIGNPGQLCLTTDFNSGIQQKSETNFRYLLLNRQALMPCLSEEKFLPLTIQTPVQHSIGIAKDSSVLLFKARIYVQSWKLIVYAEADHKFTLLFKMSNGQQHQVTIPATCCLDPRGVLSSGPSGKRATVEGNEGIIQEIFCTTFNQAVNIEKLVISGSPSVGPEHSLALQQKASAPTALEIQLQDVTWKHAEKHVTMLLMSCTIVLSNVDLLLPTKLFLKVLERDYVDLGFSRCSYYRVCDLLVPNPVHHGPGTKIALKAEQTSPVFPIVDPNFPSRMGELIVSYGENMPEPIPEA